MLWEVSFASAALAFAVVSGGLLGIICVISWIIRPESRHLHQGATYECGFLAEGPRRGVGFNFIGYATLFLVFDLAALYLFVYSVAQEIHWLSALSFLVGIATLALLILYGTQRRKYYVA